MKIFVAGIDFDKSNPADYLSKTKILINKLEEIHYQAINLMDKEVLVIIVLPEYALTYEAIPNKEKKACLNQLEKAVKNYKNMILIPGSFSAYEKNSDCSNLEKRKLKIIENYNKNLVNFEGEKTDLFYELNYKNTQSKLASEDFSESICLQNSAYIITSEDDSKRIKHMKSAPWIEQNKLPNSLKSLSNNFLYVGSDCNIKSVMINNTKLDIGLIICREYYMEHSKEIIDNPPLFEVIISSTIDISKENLFGFINIHMDDPKGLSVFINEQHQNQFKIDKIKSFFYFGNQNPIENEIIYFSNLNHSNADKFSTKTETTTQNNNVTNIKSHGLKRGFFNVPENIKENHLSNKSTHDNVYEADVSGSEFKKAKKEPILYSKGSLISSLISSLSSNNTRIQNDKLFSCNNANISTNSFAQIKNTSLPSNYYDKKIDLISRYKLENFEENSIQIGLRNAAVNNKISDLKIFIEHIININAQDNGKSKKTALHWAVEKGHKEAYELLIKAGAAKDIPDANGLTVEQLLKKNNSINNSLKRKNL